MLRRYVYQFNYALSHKLAELGLYVDRHGRPSREGIVEWEGTAEQVALHPPYILLFNSRFIEVRHLKSGRLVYIIPGDNIRCIWDGRGVNLKPSQPVQREEREPVAYISMNTSEVSARVPGVNAQQIFELQATLPSSPYTQSPGNDTEACDCHVCKILSGGL